MGNCFSTGCDSTGMTFPVREYSHSQDGFSCSITGGSVYRGSAIPQLVGTYFYADFCSGQIYSFRIRRLDPHRAHEPHRGARARGGPPPSRRSPPSARTAWASSISWTGRPRPRGLQGHPGSRIRGRPSGGSAAGGLRARDAFAEPVRRGYARRRAARAGGRSPGVRARRRGRRVRTIREGRPPRARSSWSGTAGMRRAKRLRPGSISCAPSPKGPCRPGA